MSEPSTEEWEYVNWGTAVWHIDSKRSKNPSMLKTVCSAVKDKAACRVTTEKPIAGMLCLRCRGIFQDLSKDAKTLARYRGTQ